MRKDDILRLFPDASDESVKSLLDINSADITHALDKRKGDTDQLSADLTAANAALAKANETIQALEANKGDVEKLQAEVDRYKQAEQERAEAAKRAAEHAELEERFNAAVGDKKFIHE